MYFKFTVNFLSTLHHTIEHTHVYPVFIVWEAIFVPHYPEEEYCHVKTLII